MSRPSQLDQVRALMLADGDWRTLDNIAARTGIPPQSVSARLRELRAQGFTVQRRHTEGRLYVYRVTQP